jgi:hypothetical protein
VILRIQGGTVATVTLRLLVEVAALALLVRSAVAAPVEREFSSLLAVSLVRVAAQRGVMGNRWETEMLALRLVAAAAHLDRRAAQEAAAQVGPEK